MKFNATSRSDKGTSASRRLRHAGRVPAIVYGGTAEAASIDLDHNEIYHALRKESFHASILSMELDGKSGQQVLLRAVQWHPYKQQVLHVDFQRVDAKQTLTTKVPFHFLNAETSPAVKLSGAIVSHVMTELEIVCLPANLPPFIEVDLGGLLAETVVHLSSVKLPKGVVAATRSADSDSDPVVASAHVKAGSAADAADTDAGTDAAE